MSLILDALKKLEQEKATRRGRQLDLRPAVTGRKATASPPSWRLPLLIAGAILLAVAVTVVIMEQLSRSRNSAPPAAEQLRHEAAEQPAPPLPAASHLPVIPAAPPPALPPLRTETKEPAPARPKSVSAEPMTAAPADLKVTGIAWLEERSARRAVINGALIGEGTVIGGARVVEIRQEQVRFSRDGQNFAVSITSSNR